VTRAQRGARREVCLLDAAFVDEFDGRFVIPAGLPCAHEQVDRHLRGVLVVRPVAARVLETGASLPDE
jgi:hypothetical protein